MASSEEHDEAAAVVSDERDDDDGNSCDSSNDHEGFRAKDPSTTKAVRLAADVTTTTARRLPLSSSSSHEDRGSVDDDDDDDEAEGVYTNTTEHTTKTAASADSVASVSVSSAPPGAAASRRTSLSMYSPHHQSQRPTLADLEASNAVGNRSSRFQYDEKLTLGKSMAVHHLRETHKNMTIEEQEIAVREQDQSNCIESWHSVFSSLKVIFKFLLTKETYITMALAVLSTCYFYFLHKDEEDWDGSGIPFVVLGVAVVIPTINLITMEYNRREEGLRRLGELRGVWLRLYQLHAFLDWDGGKGRSKRWGPNSEQQPMGGLLEHTDKVGDNILGACDELMRFLTLPSSTNTHNYLTTSGRMRATEILSVGEPLFESCTARRGARFTQLAEELKAAGASQTEMSRVEQFQRDMQAQYEHLRFLKMYRTPQALRSLARVTTIMMLPLFGPSYAQLAINIGSLFLGLMLTAVSALILSGLYEAARVVEDPFNAFVVMDGINVREEMDTLFRQMVAIREEAFKEEARMFPYEVPGSSCLTSSTLFDKRRSDSANGWRSEELRDETTARTSGLTASQPRTTEDIMEATPNQKNRRARFFPIR